MVKDVKVEWRWHHKRYDERQNDNISEVELQLRQNERQWQINAWIIKVTILRWDKRKGGIKVALTKIMKKKDEVSDNAWSTMILRDIWQWDNIKGKWERMIIIKTRINDYRQASHEIKLKAISFTWHYRLCCGLNLYLV